LENIQADYGDNIHSLVEENIRGILYPLSHYQEKPIVLATFAADEDSEYQ